MTNFPSVGEIRNASTFFEKFLVATNQLPGGDILSELTISTGNATPTTGIHIVDTEADAATDDLANILTTNLPDGSLLILSAADAARTVVVKHNAGGGGQVSLVDAVDFSLDDTEKALVLRRNGAGWAEVGRFYGGDTAAFRTFLGVSAPFFDGAEAQVAAATGDLVAIKDVSDANNPKFATVQSITDLVTVLFSGAEATVTAATGDLVALKDVSDANNPKFVTVQSITDLVTVLFSGAEATVTAATGDLVALKDVSDANNPKYATAQSIADLASTATGQTAHDNMILNTFRIGKNSALSVQKILDGVVDGFVDQTGVGSATNDAYDPIGDYYTSNPPFTNISTTGTNSQIGATSSAGRSIDVAKLTDGFYANLVVGESLGPNSGGTMNVEFDWGASSAKVITKCRVYVRVTDTDRMAPIQLDYWNGSSWVQDSTVDPAGTNESWFEMLPGSSNAGDKWRVNIISETGWQGITEIEMFEAGSTQNMTLISNAQTAGVQPTDAHIILFEEDVAAVTLNTDLKAYASRDGGTTWTQATLTDQGNYATGKRILTGDAVTSGQPAGTSMKWKVETLNTKELRVHGVGLQWS